MNESFLPVQKQTKVQFKPRGLLLSLLLTLLLFLILALMSIGAWNYTKQSIAAQANTRFESLATDLEAILTSRINENFAVLASTDALFVSSDNVNRVEFARYLDAIQVSERFPGISGIIFTEYVPAEAEAAFVDSVRTDTSSSPVGYPNFEIKPAGPRSEYFVYNYIYPTPATPSANFGMDFGTDPIRGDAIRKARQEGKLIITQPTQLIGTDELGFIAFQPVFQGGQDTSTVEGRQAAFIGVINGVFQAQRFFDDMFSKGSLFQTLQFTLSDVTDPDHEIVIHGHNKTLFRDQRLSVDETKTVVLNFGGRVWELDIQGSHRLLAESEADGPIIVLVTLLILSGLISAVFFFLLYTRTLAVSLAARMTASLQQSQAQLAEAKALDEAILLGIGDAVFAVDRSKNIVLFNKAAEKISGFTALEATGQPYTKILRFIEEKTEMPSERFIDEAMSGATTTMVNHTMLIRKDGTKIPVADSAAPILNAEATIKGVVVVFRDVSKERQLEQLKDEFVSLASHELRTPMTAIRGFISMIMDGDYGAVPTTLKEPLQDIGASTDRLIHLVNDMLNVSRIEAGRMKFKLAEVEPGPLVQEVVSELQPLAKQKNLQLSGPTNLLTGSKISGDVDKLKQVLNNLIGNSLKFTEQGSITVDLSLQGELVKFTVTDTGMGISEENQKKLFGKFQQISTSQAGKPTGTGLGLYLSLQLVQKMGGHLWVEHSAEGEGSVFAFTIPLVATAKAIQVEQQIETEANINQDQK